MEGLEALMEIIIVLVNNYNLKENKIKPSGDSIPILKRKPTGGGEPILK